MEKEIDINSEQLGILIEIECEHCEYVWSTESDMPRVTCPSCQRKTDRNVARKTATIPTRYIGEQESLEDIAELFQERANLARKLYERGWKSNSGIDGPNSVYATPSSDDESGADEAGEEEESLPPIESEQWDTSVESADPSEGVGMVDYISECPFCETDILVTQDDWDLDGKIVAVDEVFCHDCEHAVSKQLKAIQYSIYPKQQFRHTPDLRTASLKLRNTAVQFRVLDKAGWYLDHIRDQYVHIRYDVDDPDDIVLSGGGSLKAIDT